MKNDQKQAAGLPSGKQVEGRERIPLSTRRHSAAHVLAQAVREKWPQAKLAIGPDTEHGFFYDIESDPPIREEDLKDLEKRMKRIAGARQKFERFYLPVEEALGLLQQKAESYKIEMAEDLKALGENEISFYRNVSADGKKEIFVDMCSGPHVSNTGELGAFRLVSVAGAYWRGQEDRPMLQRVSGLLFETQEELDGYEKRLEEAKKRDHRRLGQDLELFATSEKVGPGLIFWLPRGNLIK
ncbi:MAG: threonine--tRNA ligase, partial [Candidatus Riflebacteria bacterium]